MKTIQDLSVTVTYRVGLGDIEVPVKVYNQLLEACEKGVEIDTMSSLVKYQDAADWLNANIDEADCMDWKAEIDEII